LLLVLVIDCARLEHRKSLGGWKRHRSYQVGDTNRALFGVGRHPIEIMVKVVVKVSNAPFLPSPIADA
jgi:hypothetical protein